MEVAKSLCMKGGIGDSSYANNSIVQQNAILNTITIIEEAISDVYTRIHPKTICIADLGCSSGPNTLLFSSQIINSLDKKRKIDESIEYQIYLNDLPSNDFNNIFKTLPTFQESLTQEKGSGYGRCFVAGVPGSFYIRLFPSKSLHFVHSSSSLMWLSQVPKGIEESKGHTMIATTSPPSVVRAYFEQFKRDFSSFLRLRAEEMIAGGKMVLSVIGRKGDDPRSKDGSLMNECVSKALIALVSEGLIEEEKLNSFNIPKYMPSALELKSLVEEEKSFTMNRLEVYDVHWDPYHENQSEEASLTGDQLKDSARRAAMAMRAVHEPILADQFGEEIMDTWFSRFTEILTDCMSKEKETYHVSITMALTRRSD